MKRRNRVAGSVLKGITALYLFQSTPTVKNTLICSNEFINGGGAVIGRCSSPIMTNLSLSHNESGELGSGFILYGENHFLVKNSIIWANQAKSGTLVSFRNYLCHSDVIEFRYSNIDTSANYWAAGSGIYLYQTKTKNFKCTKKMVLAK